MRENPLLDLDPDDDLRQLLRVPAEWATRQAQLPGAEPTIRAAGRRRRARTALTAAAAAAVLAVVWQVRPGGGTVTPVPVPPASRTASASPSAAPSSSIAPGPSVTPGAGSTPTTSGSTVPDIPQGFELFPEVRIGGDITSSTSRAVTTEVCPDVALPGVDRAVHRLAVLLDSPENYDERALLVFPSADDAASFVAGVERQADGCDGAATSFGGRQDVVRRSIGGPWGSGSVLLLVTSQAPGQSGPPIGTWVFVARRGAAVIVAKDQGEYFFPDPAMDQAALAQARRPIDALAPQLCRWTAAGC